MIDDYDAKVPFGWRTISKGEMIQEGDLFDSYSLIKENSPANWRLYTYAVGQPLQSNLLAIRRSNPDAAMPIINEFGRLTENSQTQKYLPPPSTFDVKERVKTYLKKIA